MGYKHLPENEKKKIVAAFERGATIEALVKEFERSRNAIRNALDEAGVRKKGKKKVKGTQTPAREDIVTRQSFPPELAQYAVIGTLDGKRVVETYTDAQQDEMKQSMTKLYEAGAQPRPYRLEPMPFSLKFEIGGNGS